MLATDETKSDTDRGLYEKEFDELQSFITAVSSKTFNGTTLFSSSNKTVTVNTNQAGSATVITLNAANLGATTYVTLASTASTFAVSSADSAAASLVAIQTAISQLASDRAQIGANLSRLETERNTISILRDNLSAARSRIVDVDVAEESANFARQQILVQSGTAMLAQANVIPQSALRLIG
jgi:flagellin